MNINNTKLFENYEAIVSFFGEQHGATDQRMY